jgi:hypothetical protein
MLLVSARHCSRRRSSTPHQVPTSWARTTPGRLNRRPKQPRDATSIANCRRKFGSNMRFSGMIPSTYTCSYRFRPQPDLSYEQMFPSSNSSLARRALGALRLTRSFLTLEDDYAVDWEVDWDEPSREAPHPHRAPLRGGSVRRRPGEPAQAPQICLSPIASSTITVSGRAQQHPGGDGSRLTSARGLRTLG